MIRLIFSSEKEDQLQIETQKFWGMLKKQMPSFALLHPLLPCGYQKVKNRFRHHCILITAKVSPLVQTILETKIKASLKKTSVFIDVDPISTFF